jgi:hypothetical protein
MNQAEYRTRSRLKTRCGGFEDFVQSVWVDRELSNRWLPCLMLVAEQRLLHSCNRRYDRELWIDVSLGRISAALERKPKSIGSSMRCLCVRVRLQYLRTLAKSVDGHRAIREFFRSSGGT